MKLLNLTKYFMQKNGLKHLLRDQKIDIDPEICIIYMENQLSDNSEIYFFSMDETDDLLKYEKNGRTFIQFFPLEYAFELISDFNLLSGDVQAAANRLLSYRINDA